MLTVKMGLLLLVNWKLFQLEPHARYSEKKFASRPWKAALSVMYVGLCSSRFLSNSGSCLLLLDMISKIRFALLVLGLGFFILCNDSTLCPPTSPQVGICLGPLLWSPGSLFTRTFLYIYF